MNKRLTQIVVILAASLLILTIYLSGKNSSSVTKELNPNAKLPEQSDWDFNLKSAIDFELQKDSISMVMSPMYDIAKFDNDSAKWLKTLAEGWDDLGHGLFAGYYYEKLAKISKNSEIWYKAGFRYFNLLNRTNDSIAKTEIGNHAIFALQKTIELDPNNLKAKAELGVCYMEILPKGVSPMTGVGLLREVLQLDSNNIEALYYLAYLSMKSGQYDKAIERLTKLTKLQPEVASYYEYLANAYLQAGDKENAAQSITTYAKLAGSNDAMLKANQFIEQLNN